MALANAAVLVESEDMPEGSQICSGYDFNAGVDYDALFGSLATHGFQATNLGIVLCTVVLFFCFVLLPPGNYV